MLTLDQVFSINLVENELTNRFSSSQDSLARPPNVNCCYVYSRLTVTQAYMPTVFLTVYHSVALQSVCHLQKTL